MSSGPNLHKIINVFTQTKVDGKEVEFEKTPIELVKFAKENDELYRFKKDIWFCCYLTKYNKEPSVVLLFTMKLPGSLSGSSSSSEIVMNLVHILENFLTPIDEFHFERSIDENKKENIAILRITKIIREDNII